MRILKSKPFLKICFIAYCALMLWLLFIRYRQIEITDYWSQLSGRINLIPLSSIGSMVRTLMENLRFDVLWVVIYNLGGNILMFVPLGFLLPAPWWSTPPASSSSLRRSPPMFIPVSRSVPTS